jgi:excisionase family DNA binding protein
MGKEYEVSESVKERVHSGLRWFNVEEAAYYLNLSPRTLYNRISRKSKNPFPVKPKKDGKLVRFDREALDAYLESE